NPPHQIQHAGDPPGHRPPPAERPQRPAITLNAPDAGFLACTRSFRQDSRSSRRHERYHISGLIGSEFALAAGTPPHHRQLDDDHSVGQGGTTPGGADRGRPKRPHPRRPPAPTTPTPP